MNKSYAMKEAIWHKEEEGYRIEISDLKAKYKFLEDQSDKFSKEKNDIKEIIINQKNQLYEYKANLKNEQEHNKELNKIQEIYESV